MGNNLNNENPLKIKTTKNSKNILTIDTKIYNFKLNYFDVSYNNNLYPIKNCISLHNKILYQNITKKTHKISYFLHFKNLYQNLNTFYLPKNLLINCIYIDKFFTKLDISSLNSPYYTHNNRL